MPFGDGTGPRGQGPMTGRGMGRCNSYYNSANPSTYYPPTNPSNYGAPPYPAYGPAYGYGYPGYRPSFFGRLFGWLFGYRRYGAPGYGYFQGARGFGNGRGGYGRGYGRGRGRWQVIKCQDMEEGDTRDCIFRGTELEV